VDDGKVSMFSRSQASRKPFIRNITSIYNYEQQDMIGYPSFTKLLALFQCLSLQWFFFHWLSSWVGVNVVVGEVNDVGLGKEH